MEKLHFYIEHIQEPRKANMRSTLRNFAKVLFVVVATSSFGIAADGVASDEDLQVTAVNPPNSAVIIFSENRWIKVNMNETQTDVNFALEIRFRDPRKPSNLQRNWLFRNDDTNLFAHNQISDITVKGYFFDGTSWNQLPTVTVEQDFNASAWNYTVSFYDNTKTLKGQATFKGDVASLGH